MHAWVLNKIIINHLLPKRRSSDEHWGYTMDIKKWFASCAAGIKFSQKKLGIHTSTIPVLFS